MKAIGIIAEYNPFHNGHAYQIKKIRELTQADYIIIAMSGDFVQRGTPAIIDKYARTKMALCCGADLVIELPSLWSTSSAESFAMAGVTLFEKMGCVTGLCFGAETQNLSLLSQIADILVEEPSFYRNALTAYLKTGLAFPLAREKAICDYLYETNVNHFIEQQDDAANILCKPNNILAIEYLKALKRRYSSITPYLLKREGAGYHETAILENQTAPTASATAIRHALANSSADSLTSAMPAAALTILNDYLTAKSFLQPNDFSSVLGYKLLTSDSKTLAAIGDCNTDIANRIYKNRMQFINFDQFCEQNKSKDITYTRISRILLHLMLNFTNQDYFDAKKLDYIPYLKILGFKKSSSALLKELKQTSQIPVISKLADAHSFLTTDALQILEKDTFAADFYEQICGIKKGTTPRSEYTREIVRIC